MKKGFTILLLITTLSFSCSMATDTPIENEGIPGMLVDILEHMNDTTYQECVSVILTYKSDIDIFLAIAESNLEDKNRYLKDKGASWSVGYKETYKAVDLKKAVENKIYFSQAVDDNSLPVILLEINYHLVPDSYRQLYKLKKIQYEDGSSTDYNKTLRAGPTNKIYPDQNKPIDKLELQLMVSYPENITKIKLSKSLDVIQTDSGEVRLIEIEPNYALVSMPNSYRFVGLSAIDKDKKYLQKRGVFYNKRMTPKEQIKYYEKLLNDLTSLEEGINSGKYDTKEKIIAAYKDILPKYKGTLNHNYYVASAFYGEIGTVLLNISNKSVRDSINFTVSDESTRIIPSGPQALEALEEVYDEED
jgi:hypothetical protein